MWSPYNYSISQCDPYFDQTGCSHPGCEPAYPTPKCVRKCVDKNQLWKQSKRYSVNAYRISSDQHSIMAEVYKNGPVEVAFTVYEVTSSIFLYLNLYCGFHMRYYIFIGLLCQVSYGMAYKMAQKYITISNFGGQLQESDVFHTRELAWSDSSIIATIFQDFAYYKSGVYKHIKGDVLGGHAVKLIGWGTTNAGEDYWVCWYAYAVIFCKHKVFWDYFLTMYSCVSARRKSVE